MNYLQTIASDHGLTVAELTKEELEIGLACSRRIRKHLAKQVINSNGNKYYQNLQEVQKIIQTYQEALVRHRIPLINHVPERIHLSA